MGETERENGHRGRRENKRARSPLHCVTKRATRPAKSMSTLMRVPRCVKIPRRRNNIGRARCSAIHSPLSLSRANCRFFFFFYLPPLFSFILRPAIHRRCHGVYIFLRNAQIEIEMRSIYGEDSSAKFYFDKPQSINSSRLALTMLNDIISHRYTYSGADAVTYTARLEFREMEYL